MCSTAGEKYELYAVYALMAAVCLSFSRHTPGQKFFQNRAVFFLGKLSLPLYLSQNLVRTLVMNYGGGIPVASQIAVILGGDFLVALLLLKAGNALAPD